MKTVAVTKMPKTKVSLIEPKRSFIVDKEKHKQLKVAAYCRVSTDSEEQLTSYANQMKYYTKYIASKKEWEFAGMFADEGITGTLATKRPEFQRMIDECLKGKIDYIITKSVSRFARNTVDCLEYVRMLKAKGIGVYFEEQGMDTLKTDSELYLVIYAGFAQSESESISKNVTWSFRKNFENGKPIYQYKKLLGYKKGDDGTPEIVPEEAKVVERIYSMYLSGDTIDHISKTLQSENLQFVGKSFTFSKPMIMNVLRNEKYCGDCILQKTVTLNPIEKTRKVNEGEAPMWLAENCHPAIISRETFHKTQEEISRRNTYTPQSKKNAMTAVGKYSRFALTDVLQCGECGTRYRRVTWSKYGKKKIVWRCVSRLDYGKTYCSESPTVEETALQQAIVRALNKFHSEDEATYLMLMRSTIGEAIGLNGGSDEIDLLQRRVETLNNRMLSLVNESVKEGADVESRENEFKEISDQIEMLNGRIKTLQETMRESNDLQSRLEEIQKTIDEREKNKFTYDDSIVRQMIECIKVYKDNKILVIFGGGYEVEEYIGKE